MKYFHKVLLAFLLAFGINNSMAAINKCVVDGKTIYTQDTCPVNSKITSEIDDSKISDGNYSTPISFKFGNLNGWHLLNSKNEYKLIKYQEPYPHLNPSIDVEYLGAPFEDPKSAFEKVGALIKLQAKDVIVSQEISEVKISVYKAFHSQFKYQYYQGGTLSAAAGDVWLIPRGQTTALILAETQTGVDPIEMNEILAIVSSFRFAD